MKQQEVTIIKLIMIQPNQHMILSFTKFSKLTGLTFNYIDETDTTIDNEVSDKSSDTKEKGLLSKFFGSRKEIISIHDN